MPEIQVLKRRMLWKRDGQLLFAVVSLVAVGVSVLWRVASDYSSLDSVQLAVSAIVVAAPIALFLYWRSPASMRDTHAKAEESDAKSSAWASRVLDTKRRS